MPFRLPTLLRAIIWVLLCVAVVLAIAWFFVLSPKWTGQNRLVQVHDPIPGARNCFWLRGPASADPYINIAYPDAATFYWGAVFTIPDGARLRIRGEFPHARYMSFISYDGAGQPVESVADYLIAPVGGAINPFLDGARRDSTARGYEVEFVNAPPPPGQPTGMNLKGQTRNKLHAPKYGAAQQAVLYRIYAVDSGQDETGGGGLPQHILTMPDGRELTGVDACKALNVAQPLELDPAALAVPLPKYRELLQAAAKITPFHPASNPPVWHQQMGRDYLYAMYTGEPVPPGITSHGGFYPNLDNQYIRTILNRKLGKVFVVRGKSPTTPRTLDGASVFRDGQLRYWSFCSNQGFANTRVNACVHDEQIPVNKDGVYTIVVSRKEDRPRNARLDCGVAWLPMADDGDGAVDADVTVFQLRHMLGAADFGHAVQSIGKPGNEERVMGEYFPKGRYVTTSAFEVALPCLKRNPVWNILKP